MTTPETDAQNPITTQDSPRHAARATHSSSDSSSGREGQGLLGDTANEMGGCDPPLTEDSFDTDCDLEYIEELAIDGGFDPNEVKQRVSEIRDRTTQSFLRDETRNTRFRKFVSDTRSGSQRLLGEADDVVFAINLNTGERWWFLKQTGCPLSAFERDIMACLHRWAPVDTGGFRETCDELEKDLVVCVLMMRFFLG